MKIATALGLALLLAAPAPALDAGGAVTVTPLLKTTTSWDGTPLRWPAGQAELTAVIVEIAPGGDTGWHRHPVQSFGMLLDGELRVTLKDGRSLNLKPGDALAEVVDTSHRGVSVGARPARILMFYAGAAGTPTTRADDAR